MTDQPFLIRSLVHYDTVKDSSLPARGLDLRYGQVVAVLDCYDKNWWKVCPVHVELDETNKVAVSMLKSAAGLIPSEKRFQKKLAKTRGKKIEWRDSHRLEEWAEYAKEPQNEEDMLELEKNAKLHAKKNKNDNPPPFQVNSRLHGSVRNLANNIDTNIAYKNLDKPTMANEGATNGSPGSSNNDTSHPHSFLSNQNKNNNSGSTTSVNSNYSNGAANRILDAAHVYEYVVPHITSLMPRPIIILGYLRDRINDKLNQFAPHKFASVVPHTTRRIREGEVDGQDYWFVSHEQMMEDIQNEKFIEAGKYNDQLYGTSLQAIRDTASENKYALLDVSGNAIQQLLNDTIHPIVILPKIPAYKWILDDDPGLNEMKAREMFKKAESIESAFAAHCTTQILVSPIDTIDSITDEVVKIVEESTNVVWAKTTAPSFK